jgi:hypothetical protein
MEFTSSDNFPLEWDTTSDYSDVIKWTRGHDKQEIYSQTLNKFEIGHIVAHCLTVIHKIDKQVGINDEKRFLSYKEVLPRTLSISLLATWDQVAIDFPLESEDVVGFQTLLRHFFAVHCTDDDQHELLDSIRTARMPCTMKTQVFFYRLR